MFCSPFLRTVWSFDVTHNCCATVFGSESIPAVNNFRLSFTMVILWHLARFVEGPPYVIRKWPPWCPSSGPHLLLWHQWRKGSMGCTCFRLGLWWKWGRVWVLVPNPGEHHLKWRWGPFITLMRKPFTQVLTLSVVTDPFILWSGWSRFTESNALPSPFVKLWPGGVQLGILFPDQKENGQRDFPTIKPLCSAVIPMWFSTWQICLLMTTFKHFNVSQVGLTRSFPACVGARLFLFPYYGVFFIFRYVLFPERSIAILCDRDCG